MSHESARRKVARIVALLFSLSSFLALGDTNSPKHATQEITSNTGVVAGVSHETVSVAATQAVSSSSSNTAVATDLNPTSRLDTAKMSPAEGKDVGASKGEHRKDRSPDSQESHIHFGWFIDGTAAIFGILAVVFALFVLLLGYRGWSEFTKLMQQVDQEVAAKLESAVEKRVGDFFENKLTPRLEAMFVTKQAETVEKLNSAIADELDRAKTTLRSEVPKVLSDDEVCRQVVDLAVAEVGRKLLPGAPPSKPDEFEPTAGAS